MGFRKEEKTHKTFDKKREPKINILFSNLVCDVPGGEYKNGE
jgi:hypothetical protein